MRRHNRDNKSNDQSLFVAQNNDMMIASLQKNNLKQNKNKIKFKKKNQTVRKLRLPVCVREQFYENTRLFFLKILECKA